MTTYVALLRGINVGGRHKVTMGTLRELLEEAGCRDVQTYVQSGNVVFDLEPGDVDRVADRLAGHLGQRLGFTPRVMVLTAQHLAAVVHGNPFVAEAAEDPTKVHVAFAGEELATMPELAADDYLPERFVRAERVVYLHLPHGMGRSRLAIDLGRQEIDLTMRNWRTVSKLHELVQAEN